VPELKVFLGVLCGFARDAFSLFGSDLSGLGAQQIKEQMP
jgi:hypothetical protein